MTTNITNAEAAVLIAFLATFYGVIRVLFGLDKKAHCKHCHIHEEGE